MRSRWLTGALLAGSLLCPSRVHGQGIEIVPFTGYRFGGDFFEIESGRRIDRDGALSAGVVLNVPMWPGFQFEGLFTHQSADLLLPAASPGRPERFRVIVEHFQGGGLQELGSGGARPFLTGTLGLTRYAAPGDNEVRFSIGAGGGVKLFPWRYAGVRVDGRVVATFVDLEGRAGACSSGRCLLAVHADVVWQAEFTAGIVFRLR